jgi:myosin heavy subunit
MVLRHLVGRTAASNKNKNSAHSIDARLLSSNPITEAFGNASTKRNENSSRFGKLLRLHFKQDLSQGTTGQALWGIAGASVRTYLLERSRISLHESGERNFHVFYQVLKPHKEWLLNTTEFRYLRALSGPESSVKDLLPNGKLDESRSQDEQDYKELMASFENLAFSSGLVTEILKCVCAILHLGNVEFEDDEASTEGEVALVTKSSQKHLDQCAALLGLSPEGLTTVLVQRRIEIKGDVTMVKRNPSGAAFARDAVAKGCYAGLFDFLIRKIDQALADEGESDVASLPFVGVLDIFGFGTSLSFEFTCLMSSHTLEIQRVLFAMDLNNC